MTSHKKKSIGCCATSDSRTGITSDKKSVMYFVFGLRLILNRYLTHVEIAFRTYWENELNALYTRFLTERKEVIEILKKCSGIKF